METLVINTDAFEMTEDQFYKFCVQNRDLKIERDSKKQIFVMSPTTFDTGNRNAEIIGQLSIWNRKHKLGYVFDSSTGFTLPNKAVRSPDAAWIKKERVMKLSEKDKHQFAHICPDFIVELRSKSDSLKNLQDKMDEWISNGCRLGWLIDFEEKKILVYKPGKAVQEVSFMIQPGSIGGEDVLPGFELNLKEIV